MRKWGVYLICICAHLEGIDSAPRPKLIIPPSERTIPQLPSTALQPSGELFTHPGVVALRNGQWFGSDNFVNLSKSIAIQVNIVKPTEASIPFKEEAIYEKIGKAFETAGLSTNVLPSGEKPPLPLFSMQVMIYPVRDGFVAACQGRLFEEVQLNRLRLGQEGVFQAITWEHVTLVVGASDQFEKLVMNNIETISNNFVKRLAVYQGQTK